ncbi:MAG: (Fe-S)-binding protein [Myxococcales bacterium]|nr:(Fe-S)-binding protein [Myxococcales bacterium]
MDLKLDAEDLNTCVSCGLCLPHCPTFRVTGEEAHSPRGRIALMRQVHHHNAPVTDEVLDAFSSCVQCRGCEPACPSGVPFGRLIERTRETLAEERIMTSVWQRVALKSLAWPALIRFGSLLLAFAQRLRLVPRRLGVPAQLPIRRAPLVASGRDVYLFTGCVMDAWQRDTHLAAQRVIEAAGFGVTPTGNLAPCCGALHLHSGLARDTKRLAARMIAKLDDRPILVDSAGCGAAMKEYGGLLRTDEARAFSSRVYDIQEWLAQYVERLPRIEPLALRVAVQDPCHLRHVQRVHNATRTVLQPFVKELVELDDDGLCCGAGGAYSVLEPQMADKIRRRKLVSIELAAPDIVASANPGCSMHLASGGVETLHPLEIIDRALREA